MEGGAKGMIHTEHWQNILPWGSSISASIPESKPKSASFNNGESGLSGRSVDEHNFVITVSNYWVEGHN